MPWSVLGLEEFAAVCGEDAALFRNGAHVRGAADKARVRVAYGPPETGDPAAIDGGLLCRVLFPCEPDHRLAAVCSALGVPWRPATPAVSLGWLFLRLVAEAARLDREVLQVLAYLSGGRAQELLLGVMTVASAPEAPQGESEGAAASAPPQRAEGTTTEDVLGAGGLLARDLPTHEVRRGQLAMAASVAETLRRGGALCAEAGPGTGKTFAYLVPALTYLEEHPAARVLVCTRTKQLQEQIFRKDLPFLASCMGAKASVALLKGRENYLCLRRWEALVREMSEGLERGRLSSLAALGRWVFETATGDVEENSAFLAQDDARELWYRLGDSPTTCSGSFCPHVEECFSIRARRYARKADLVVVNHSLLLGDAATGNVVLGKYDHLIVDEAHALEAAARLAFTLTLSEARVDAVADALGPGRGGRRHGWFDRLPLPPGGTPWAKAIEASEHVRLQAGRVLHAVGARVVGDRRGRMPDLSAVAPELETLRSRLLRWEGVVEETIDDVRDEPELAHEGEGGLAAIHGLVTVCEVLASPADDNTVHWYEREAGRLALHVTPLDVGAILAEKLFQVPESVVLTSATLSLAGDFEYFEESLGLPKAYAPVEATVVESPFPYERLMRILVPADFPSVASDSEAYAEALASLLESLHAALGRNGLVLFTSYELLFDVHERIRSRVPTLAQGVDGSRSAVLERFRQGEGGGLLLGTDSFWEGVDLPGEELEYVVVTRLPFAVPTDPVFAALSADIERRGRDAFAHLALPQAVLRLRQGVGRLIRTSSDRGVVIITDDRIRTKPYGRRFAEALPVRAETLPTARDVVREAGAWFGCVGKRGRAPRRN